MTEQPIDAETFDRLVDMTGGDMAFVDDLVDTYLDDGRQQVDALLRAQASGDVEAMIRPAHSLKSGSLNVGALRLGELCRSLEETARGAGAVPNAVDRVTEIAAAFASASTALLDARSDRTESGGPPGP